MDIDSIIFDLDGTLWDTCKGCADTWNLVLAEKNIPYKTLTEIDMELIMGKNHVEIRELFFSHLPISESKPLMEEILFRENEVIPLGGWKLYDGVSQGLKKLASRYPLFIVSNCQEGYLQAFNTCTNLVDDFIKDYEYIGRTGKPKGENIQDLIQRNRLTSPIYIGDTPGDMKSANFAKCAFAFVSYGFGEIENPPLQFDAFDQLVAHFLA